jgi:sigma54-dependent transcription regulator
MIHTDVRVICATHRNLPEIVDERHFRADLFYRLSVFPIELPPLRERSEDIPLLVRNFAMEYAARMRKPITGISEEIRACDAGRRRTLSHRSDSRADRECGRRPEWRRCPAGGAADDLDRQNEATGT